MTTGTAGSPQVSIAALAAEWGVALRRVESGPAALQTLPGILADFDTSVLGLLTDGTEKRYQGRDLDETVRGLIPAGAEIRALRSTGGAHGTVLDEVTVDAATDDARGVTLLLSVGSGTITDLAKRVVAELGIPLVVVQTAASVNGYSDSLSVLVRNGAKRTSTTAWPNALVIDHDVLREAPDRLTRSGVGDGAAIWVAPADWYLACALGLDGPFDDTALRVVTGTAEVMRSAPVGSPESFAALVDTLTLGGLGIGVTGTTACISGCEHLVSHLLDMAAMAEHAEHDLHGAQVGVATVVSAALWEIALQDLDLGSLDPARLVPPADLRERVEAAWIGLDPTGALGAECWAAVERKFVQWAAAGDQVRAFFADWSTHVGRLRELAYAPEVPAEALRVWHAPMRFAELTPPVDADRARWALRSLPFMRDRFTLTDLLLLAGHWDDALIDRVLERAARAGGGI